MYKTAVLQGKARNRANMAKPSTWEFRDVTRPGVILKAIYPKPNHTFGQSFDIASAEFKTMFGVDAKKVGYLSAAFPDLLVDAVEYELILLTSATFADSPLAITLQKEIAGIPAEDLTRFKYATQTKDEEYAHSL